MPFGILEDHHLELVPGTACLNDQSDLPAELHDVPSERLKHGEGKYSHVILVPQPSDDPNDPLNWSTLKKDIILLIVAFNASVVGAYGPMLGPGFIEIAAELGITVTVLSQSTAWLILTLGLCVFFINPLGKIYGKRPVYIFSGIILFVVSIWGAVARSYPSFLASRIVGALGMAPYEVLVQSTIADMYFVHQRGTRLAVWNLFLLCGIAGAGFISGYIIENLGYKWTFGICAILFGLCMFALVFYVPETSYVRARKISYLTTTTNTDQENTKMGSTLNEKAEGNDDEVVHFSPIPAHVTGNGSKGIEPRYSYARSMALFSGRYTDAPVWRIFTRPLIVFFYPGVLWGFLIYGTILTWLVVFSVVNGVIFVSAPYNFTVGQAGLTSLSPFILSGLGELISGPLNDFICLKLAKRNHGIYEPEFRLPIMALVAVLGTVGFFGFGITVHDVTSVWGPIITYGLANMSLAFASTCVFGYVLDSYPRLAEEAFVAINLRNLLTFGLTYFVESWLVEDGAQQVFCVLGGCMLGVVALTIPLWVFGKKIRSAIARSKFLTAFMQDM